MAVAESTTTTVSTKGQVILPKAIRERRKWGPGTRLIVEETAEGVLLKPAPLFAPTKPEMSPACSLTTARPRRSRRWTRQ